MAGIFIPHEVEHLDAHKKIDIRIMVDSKENISSVVDELIKSSYPYTRKNVIDVYNYPEVDYKIPWRHQIQFHKGNVPFPARKGTSFTLEIQTGSPVHFHDGWWLESMNIIKNGVSPSGKGWKFIKND
tara:strand:- start:155 stop:538 length:384 start_codon:yes stop_codon:yes gene_type:complete